MKKTLVLSLSALPCLFASAQTYNFAVNNGNWNASANWSPPGPATWTSSHTGIVENLTVRMNANIASDASRPVMIARNGGVFQIPNGGADTVRPNFILDGGGLEFDRGYFELSGAVEVRQPATLSFFNSATSAKLTGAFTGSATLTIAGNLPASTSNWDWGPRFSGNNSGFSGAIHVRNRIYYNSLNELGTGPVTIHTGGIVDFNFDGNTRNFTLSGGALRSYGSRRYDGFITLTTNSWLDAFGGAHRLTIDKSITGTGNITVGTNFTNGDKPGNGVIGLNGDNRNWIGDLILCHTNATIATTFATNNMPVGLTHNVLPVGAIIAPNTKPCMIEFSGNAIDWSITNRLTGPLSINASANRNRRLTLNNTVLEPAGTPATVGTTTVSGRLTLNNSTLRLKLLTASARDQLVIAPQSGGAAGPTLELINTTLDVTSDYNYNPNSVIFLVVNSNATATAISGEFNSLTNNATVTLCQTPLRTAKISYFANAATGLATGGNSIALYDFFNGIPPVAPLVSTGSGAGDVRAKSATLNGLLIAGTPAPDVFFCWGDTDPGSEDPGDWQHTIPMTHLVDPQTGAFSFRLTGLEPATLYHYACFGVNYNGPTRVERWCEPVTFTTLPMQEAYWKNPAWNNVNNTTAFFWTVPTNWEPGLPADAGFTGYVTNGFTATVSGDIGPAGDHPNIVVTTGGTLFIRDASLNTPVTLAGGTIDYNSRVSLYGGLHVTADSLITNGDTGDGNGRKLGNLSMLPGVTLTSRGATYFDGNNPDFHGTLVLDGRHGTLNTYAFGDASVILTNNNTQFSFDIDWANGGGQPLTLVNPFSGNGILWTGVNGTGLTVNKSLAPGFAGTGGTLVANTRKFTLASTASLDINLWSAQNHGQLVVTNNNNFTNIAVDFTARPTLNIRAMPGFKAKADDKFILLRNHSANPINGTFVNYAEDDKVNLGYATGNITYKFSIDNGPANNIAIHNIRLNGTLFMLR